MSGQVGWIVGAVIIVAILGGVVVAVALAKAESRRVERYYARQPYRPRPDRNMSSGYTWSSHTYYGAPAGGGDVSTSSGGSDGGASCSGGDGGGGGGSC